MTEKLVVIGNGMAAGRVLDHVFERDADRYSITMFGAEWCGDCRRSKKLLDTLGVDYDYIDLEAVEDAASEAEAIAGRKNIPVIAFPDGTHQVEPTDPDLHAKLTGLGAL